MGRPFLALAFALGAVSASLGTATTGAWAATSGRSGPTVTLVSQTPWVGPGQSMQLRLDLSGASLSSLSLTVTLYDHLTSRSAFAETAAGTAVGAVLGSATVSASSLLPVAPGEVSLTIPVASGDAPATGSGPLVANLDCPAGSCGGVYPLKLQLSSNGGEASSLITYLVYADPPATTEKVRLAWLVPVSLPVPTAGMAGPDTSAATVGQLTALLQAISAHPADDVSLDPQPATVESLSNSSLPAAKAALASLQTLSTQAAHETLAGPFVPVDASALVSSGLDSELADQVRQGEQTLAPMHPASGTWLTSGALDQASIAELGSLGLDRLVVPAADVGQSTGPALSVTAPYTISTGQQPNPSAAQSDAQLASDMSTPAPGSAALGAYRTLADLALLYYEQPNDIIPRGVVLSTGGSSSLRASTVDIVLDNLPNDPLVSPVTLDDFFAQVPMSSASRRLSSAAVTSSLPARPIRAARVRLDALTGSVDTAGAGVVRDLDDQLLWSENDQLRPEQQQQAVTAFNRSLDAQLSTVSIRTDTIKLTSTAAKVPLTVTKQSGYGLSAVLRITGDKVVFPAGSAQDPGPVCRSYSVQSSTERSTFTCVATLDLATNAVYVDMRARVSGDFRLTITLTSASGGLVIASSDVTVHSMSTSLVAVVLSAAALIVLLGWWGRTLWRRQPARGKHARRRLATTSEGGP